MGTMRLILFTILLMFFSQESLFSQVQKPDVPQPIVQYLEKNFPGQTMIRYKLNWTPEDATYKIDLSNQVKIEFDHNFVPTTINSNSGISKSLLPKELLYYLEKKYPNMEIKSWEKKITRQEVELQNGMELTFDLKGNLIKIED